VLRSDDAQERHLDKAVRGLIDLVMALDHDGNVAGAAEAGGKAVSIAALLCAVP